MTSHRISLPPFNSLGPTTNIWASILFVAFLIGFARLLKRRKQALPEPHWIIDYLKLSGTPLPTPLPGFDLDKARARPYRPLRWNYHQTMAMMPLEPDWWLEIESTYQDRVNQRQELYAKHGEAVLDWQPGSEAACKELMYMVIQFLCTRYPTLFSLDPTSGIFCNRTLRTTHDINRVEPLRFLLDNVPEDFLITQKDSKTRLYHLRAAVSCSAVGWSLKEKMGRPMHEIHSPVPDYAAKLQTSVDRFFDRMPMDKPIQRGSWSFELGRPLYLMADDPAFLLHKQMDPNLSINDIHLRVDWQTLRRLPQSNAIVFNFKALFTPVTQFKDEAYVPALVTKVLGECKNNIKAYKGWAHLEHKLLPALDGWAEDQVAKGIVPEGWKVRTLDEHPFYPGWNSTGEWD